MPFDSHFDLHVAFEQVAARPDDLLSDLPNHYRCTVERKGEAAIFYYSHGDDVEGPTLWRLMHALVWDDQYLDFCDDPDDLERELGIENGPEVWERLEEVRKKLDRLFPDVDREDIFDRYGIPF